MPYREDIELSMVFIRKNKQNVLSKWMSLARYGRQPASQPASIWYVKVAMLSLLNVDNFDSRIHKQLRKMINQLFERE